MSSAIKKPKCGAKSQSCGKACIEAKDTCQEAIDKNVAAGLLAAIKGGVPSSTPTGIPSTRSTFSNQNDLDKSFDDLLAKYPLKAGVTNVETDLGNGVKLWTITHRASDGSGDTMKYALLQTAQGSYTISDSRVKEVTDQAKNAVWKEALYASLRAAAGQDVAQQVVSPPAATASAKAKQIASPVVLPVAAGLDKARAALIGDFGSKAVADAEANVAKVLADEDTQVYIRLGSQDVLAKILSGGRMATSAELGKTDHSIPDLQDANYQTARNRVEDKVLGIPVSTAPKDRPIYGYLGSASSDQMVSKSHADTEPYGSISIKLKSESKSRATFTGSDSFKSGHASSVDKPSAASLVSDTKFGYDVKDKSAPITSYARSAAQDQRSGALALATKAKNVNDLARLAPTGANYLEAQIHGGVKPSDIDEINFKPKSLKDTPSLETIGQAIKAGIKVKIHGVEYTSADLAKATKGLSKEATAIESSLRGDQKDMKSFGDAVLALSAKTSAATSKGASQDPNLFVLQQSRGFTAKPTVVTEAQLDAKLKAGGSLAVRGLQGSGKLSASQVAEATRTGEHYIGYGIYGHGMYVGHSGSFYDPGNRTKDKASAKGGKTGLAYVPSSSKSDIDSAYEGPTSNGYISSSTAEVRMHVPATAKVATQDQVLKEMQTAAKNWDSYAKNPANKISASDKDKVAKMAFGDTDGGINDGLMTRFAVMSGYDAVALTKSYEPDNFMVIVNHSMLSMADKDADKKRGRY